MIDNNNNNNNNTFKIITNEIPQIDPQQSIVICTPFPFGYGIEKSITGSLKLISNKHDEISGKISYNDTIVMYEITLPMKISTPKNIRPSFEIPINGYIIYFTESSYNNTIDNIILKSNISLTLHILLRALKEKNKTMCIRKGDPLINLYFNYIYYLGNNYEMNISDSILIRNTTIYNNFEKYINNI